tara:strand:+ start:859 stop:978 length:120 start_codon:yes stop_codon:yes gene_type:complete
MKTLNLDFEDKEYKVLKKAKERLNCKSWREFMLRCAKEE